MIKTNSFGWYYITCDYCDASFGLDDVRVRANKEETIREARRVNWKIGKDGTFCNAHRNLENRLNEIEYRKRYAIRLTQRHGYTEKEAKESAASANFPKKDFYPEEHADNEAIYGA